MLVYFDLGMQAAAMGKDPAICQKSITSFESVVAVGTGVRTLGGRTVIAVQLPPLALVGASARKSQRLAAVGLDASGTAANGVIYLPGYTYTNTNYRNKSAFLTWLNTVTNDPQALNLP